SAARRRDARERRRAASARARPQRRPEGRPRRGRNRRGRRSGSPEHAPTRRGRRARARSVLDHRPDLDRSAAPGRRDLRGELDRFVDRAALDEVEAAEVLLRLRERAVRRERLSVVDADRRRAREVAEVGAAAGLRTLGESHVLLHLPLLLLLAEPLPAVAGAVDQERVLHVCLLRSLTTLRRTRSRGIDTFLTEHSLEERERPGLVERLVQVAALRALHAGGASVLAGAAGEELRRVAGPALEGLEAALGDPDPAGVAVVDEDRRRTGLEVEIRREPADVPAVAHRPERQQGDQRVLGRVERPEEAGHVLETLEHPRLGDEPDRLGLELGLRQRERDQLEALLRLDRLLLIADDLLGDDHAAERELDAETAPRLLRLHDRGRRLLLRLRVVVAGE